MAAGARRDAGHTWFATLLGILVLVAGGFVLGLLVGVVSQEPELVVGHVAGRSTEIAWSAVQAPVGQVAAAASSEPVTRPIVSRPASEPVAQSVSAPIGQPITRPVSAPPPAEVPPPVASAGASYAVQVGAFGAASAAGKVVTGLRARGYPVYVVESPEDGRFRVRVGPVEGREEADQMARQLKVEEKLPTWVLRERGD